MNIESQAKKWESAETDIFYENLLKKALSLIPESGAVMVLGPMFVLRSFEENAELFTSAIKQIEANGDVVFNQIPYVDYVIKDAPFEYKRKFEIFYKGLITSGKITKVYLLPEWKQSEGTHTEIEYAKQANIPIVYL